MDQNMSKTFVAAAAIAATLGISGSAVAQLPPGVFAGQPDFHLAAKGAYDIDPTHTAIIAKVLTSAIRSASSASKKSPAP